MSGRIRKRSVIVAGHRTSVSLEEEFWAVIRQIADSQNLSLNQLVTTIDRSRDGNLSSALRLFALDHLRTRHSPANAGSPAENGTPPRATLPAGG